MKTLWLQSSLRDPSVPLSLPFTPTKEHCASGAFHRAPRMLDPRKEISTKTINMSNNPKEGKREKISLKPNIQKGQEEKAAM